MDNFFTRCLEQTMIWPTKKLVKANLPTAFNAYPRTRVIIDCTEFKIQKPFRPRAQRATWSNYKHANTAKLLVGIMPSGAFTFVSKVYSGSISDLAIVEKTVSFRFRRQYSAPPARPKGNIEYSSFFARKTT